MKSYIKYFPLPKAYFTQNYFVPHQKRLLLNYLKEKKVDIYLAQHGGIYGTGMDKANVIGTPEKVEKNIKEFFNLGMEKNKIDIPFVSKFANVVQDLKIGSSIKKNILFCSNLSVRYLAKQHGLPRTMLDSLDTIKMINDISSHLKRKNIILH